MDVGTERCCGAATWLTAAVPCFPPFHPLLGLELCFHPRVFRELYQHLTSLKIEDKTPKSNDLAL